MGRMFRRKIFFSWVGGLISSALSKEILDKSWKFSIIFGVIMASILTIYFIADYYELFNLIEEEIESWFECEYNSN